MFNLRKHTKEIKGTVELPASKSISNRLLLIRSLCANTFQINNLSLADDTMLMAELLKKIDDYKSQKDFSAELKLDTKNAGTVFRFLTAYLASTAGNFLLTGNSRMLERPVGVLVDSLRKIGAEIEYLSDTNYPPLRIKGKKLKGGEIEIKAGISSQFISALLMIGPIMKNGLILNLKGMISSKPYIEMTRTLMQDMGVELKWIKDRIIVPPSQYSPKQVTVESDWSSASYWYLMAAFSDEVNLEIRGLKSESIQGDAILPEIFKNFGVKTEFNVYAIRLTKSQNRTGKFEFDFTNYPDLAQSVAVCCAGLNVPARLKGLRSLKIKETDRLLALQNELTKIGVIVEITDDELIIYPTKNKGLHTLASGNSEAAAHIHTYHDHRMAMAFAPLSILLPEIRIENPDVVKKSYPGFWDDMKSVGFEL